MKKIKICYVTDTWFPIIGGGPQVCWNFAKTLVLNYNCSVDIITRNLEGEQDRELKLTKGISIIKLGPKTKWNSIFARLLFIIQSFRYILANDYSLIHAFPFISGVPAFIAGKVKNIRVVFSIFTATSFLEKFLCFSIPYDMKITDNLQIKNKFKSQNLFYIPNGVDIKLFDSVRIRKSNKKRIIFVGRFHKQKGINTLLAASLFIIKDVPDIKIEFIGYGDELVKIKNFVKKNRVEHYFDIKSPIYDRNLIKEYKNSSVLVLPSNYEGQGIVVLEAWAAKIPVVATKVGSLRSIIKNGENGYLVSKNNPKELAKIVKKTLNRKLGQRMGNRGYELVKNKFTWEKSVAKLYQHYLQLI